MFSSLHIMKLLRRLLILSLAAFGFIVKAELNTRLFDAHDIVASDYRGITRDSEGYLWIGTNSGVLRFEGYNFDRYSYDDSDETSLSDNRVLRIMSDSKGRLWVATCEGLNLFNPLTDSFTRINIPNHDFYGYISDVVELKNGEIIFEASGVDLYRIKEEKGGIKVEPFGSTKEIYRKITTLAETEDGTLIGGTHSGELIAIQGPKAGTKVKVSDSSIRTLLSDGKGRVFAANADGAWIWYPMTGNIERIQLPDQVMPLEQSSQLTDKGDILIGTLNNGVLRLKTDTKSFEQATEFRNPRINPNNSSISSIYEDSNGDIWLGCGNKGILLATETQPPTTFLNIEECFPEQYGGSSHITVSDDGNTIIGYRNGMLTKMRPDGRIESQIHLPSGIGCLLSSKTGNRIYLGVDNQGLYEYLPGDNSIRPIHKIPGFYQANAITEDQNGNIYLGILGTGVKKINTATGEGTWIKDVNNGFNPIWPESLYCDKNNQIWIGLYSALWIYSPQSGLFTSISGKHPAMVKAVHNAFAEGWDGRIWDATSNGVFIIEPKNNECVHLTPKEGLSDLYNGSIVIDKDGYAWVGSNREINRIDKDYNITRYKGKGADSDNDYRSAAWNPEQNRVLFAGTKGITSINTQVTNRNSTPGELKISGIYLNSRKVNAESLNADGSKVEGGRDKEMPVINISHDDNLLEIHVSPFNFSYSDNIVYEWRIKGLSEKWNTSDDAPGIIKLPHLPSGKHILEVRGVENGVYTSVQKIKIKVSWPWYLSPLAKAVYAAIIFAFLYMGWRIFRHRQTEHVNDEKIKFFMNISHEIRSPLTLILGPLEKLMNSNSDQSIGKQYKLMHRNATRILALTNQLLDMRKIEKGKMKLDRHNVELTSFIRELVEMFQSQADERHIDLQFIEDENSKDDIYVNIDSNNFDKVLVNLISNALKYTEQGNVTVETRKAADENGRQWAEIIVSDTGIGLDPKMIGHLFDRFYQGNIQNRSNMGFGIGLDLCKMLVDLHGGTISAKNREDGNGSVFTVRIPLSESEATDGNTSSDATERIKSALPTSAYSRDDTPNPSRSNRNTRLRILVVDDDREMRDYITDAFRSAGTIMAAASGKEAIQLIHDYKFDLIITDVVMPDMDGLELLKTVRKYSETSHLPVIMLSSQNEVDDRMRGWDSGADAYVGKPFSMDELIAVADNLIESRMRLKGKFSGASDLEGKVETPELKGNDDEFMRKVADEINRHLSDPELNVERLCENIGMSRTHLNRKMKEVFGYSPSEFIRNIRMKKACELLENPDVDISQIAYSVGFTSQAHFSTSFKKMSGVTPTEYRLKKSDAKRS